MSWRKPPATLTNGGSVDQRALGCLLIPDLDATFCADRLPTWRDVAPDPVVVWMIIIWVIGRVVWKLE